MRSVATLISGTGWASNLEHDARKLAREMGIRSIAVIDHWAGYRERFVRDGELILPDEVWVSDAYAKAELMRCFPEIPVSQLPNLYLEELVNEIAAFQPELPNENPQKVLYLLEPIRRKWNDDFRPGELQAFEYFVDFLKSKQCNDVNMLLRPHPSDEPGKYSDWINRFPGLNIQIDSKSSLASQIAWADWVVGCETFALIPALEAGRIVFSSLPPWAPPCSLPHLGIRYISGFRKELL
jgi:hypothetical protein